MKQKELDFILRHDMLQMYFDKAGRVLCKENPSKDDFDYLSSLTEQVLEWNDVVMALQYAKFISCVCGKKFRPYIKLEELQDKVIKSGDDSYMYDFATEVVGANIKEIMKHMYDATLYHKLKRDITPFDELTK